MARTIHRFSIGPSGAALALPANAQLLRVEHDYRVPGLVDMWIILDPESDTITRTFEFIGTGHPVPDDGTWVASTDKNLYSHLVWHLFETTPIQPEQRDEKQA